MPHSWHARGVIASLAISATPNLIPGITASVPITVTAKDAAGYTIVGTHTTPVAATPFAIASLKTTCLNSRAGGAPQGLYPCDLQNAYSLASATTAGTGKTIAIVDAYDDPNAESDLAVYRAEFNLPPCTTANGCFTKVDQNGGKAYPALDPTGNWEGEE